MIPKKSSSGDKKYHKPKIPPKKKSIDKRQTTLNFAIASKTKKGECFNNIYGENLVDEDTQPINTELKNNRENDNDKSCDNSS